MKLRWLEQSEYDVPAENSWLSPSEILCLNRLHIAKRRADWRRGRWTAKLAIASYLDIPADFQALAGIEIRPASSGAPEAFVLNVPAPIAISLSHSTGMAICALAPCGVELGCDMELIEPRSDAFVADYFAPEEHELIAHTAPAVRSLVLALLWSGKESALKALRQGLRLDTRDVIVSFPEDGLISPAPGWSSLRVRYVAGQTFQGWWRVMDGVMRTLVADPSPYLPIRLMVPTSYRHDAEFELAGKE